MRAWCVLGVLPLLAAASVFAQTGNDLEPYVGRYSDYSGSENYFEVTRENGVLHLEFVAANAYSAASLEYLLQVGRGRIPLEVRGGRRLRLEGSPVEIVFHRNDVGDVEALTYELRRQERRWTRTELLDAQYEAVADRVRPNGLSDAVLKGDVESARILIDKGIDIEELDTRPNLAGANGRKPLNWAAVTNNTEMIELLLDAGADIDSANKSGFSPLHHAAEYDSVEAVTLLIERGADIRKRTRDGETPMDIAEVRNAFAALEVLKAAMESR